MSEQIRIRVYVSAAVAARLGVTRYGESEVAPTDEQWAALSEQERTALLKYVRNAGVSAGSMLAVDAPTWEGIVAALRAELAQEAAKAEAEAKKSEEAIQKALRAPLDAWLDSGPFAAPMMREWPRCESWSDDDRKRDPRIVARREEARRELFAPATAAWEAERARRDAANEAAKAEQAAAKEAATAAIVALAKGFDDLARPAQEGYSVTRAVLDRLATELMSSVSVAGMQAEIDESVWSSTEDRAAPSPETFALLDRVTAAARAANERLPKELGRWEVSRIVRVDACPHPTDRHVVTAVLATLDTAIGVRQITFSLESLECEHDRADD